MIRFAHPGLDTRRPVGACLGLFERGSAGQPRGHAALRRHRPDRARPGPRQTRRRGTRGRHEGPAQPDGERRAARRLARSSPASRAAQFTAGSLLSASMLDAVGGPVGGGRRPSSFLIAAGLATAPVTVAAGWADWSESHEDQMRVGLVHAASNAVALRSTPRRSSSGPAAGAVGCCRWPAGRSPAPARCSAVTWATGRRPARTTARRSRTSARRTGSRSARWPRCRSANRSSGWPATCPCSCCARPARTASDPTASASCPTAARTCRPRCTRATSSTTPARRTSCARGTAASSGWPTGAWCTGRRRPRSRASSRGWWATSCRRGSSGSPGCPRR